jgi:hypothetical protein
VKQRLEAAKISDDLFSGKPLQEVLPPVHNSGRGERMRYIPPTGFM